MNITNNTDKLLYKISNNFLSCKSSINNFITNSNEISKLYKTTNVTPSNKIKKINKENLYSSIFQSTKATENITPFDYDREVKRNKTKIDFNFLYQIGSGGFGRVWKV
jgi:hypothetical protein